MEVPALNTRITEDARDCLDHAGPGLTRHVAANRIVEWFYHQPEEIQAEILEVTAPGAIDETLNEYAANRPVKMQLTEEAIQNLADVIERSGCMRVYCHSRIVEWFASRSPEIQVAILGLDGRSAAIEDILRDMTGGPIR